MSNTVEALLHTACTHAERGELDTAASQLGRLLIQEPGNAAAMQLLGLVQLKQGELRTAARTLRHACVVAPAHGPLHVHLARVEWEIGLPARAVATYQQAIALGCATPDILIDCAIALSKLQRHAEAIDMCRKALDQAPLDARGWQTQANLLHAMKSLDEALACHERAIALMPSPIAWSGKALTLDALGRLEEALACHDQAVGLCPDDASMLTHRGLTLGNMERHEEAISSHLRATELAPSLATAWSNLGASLCRAKRPETAIAAHDKAVSLSPSSAAMWLQRGAALIDAGRHAEALASCNAAVRLDANSAAAWRHRALALISLGRCEDALASVVEACDLDINCVQASHMRAGLLFLLDRTADAFAWLEHACWRHPEDEMLRFCLGTEQLRRGEFAQGWINIQLQRNLFPVPCLINECIPAWSGTESLEGKQVLVHAEQGFGDVIQFSRLVPQLASMGCTVYFVVYPALKQLFSCLDNCQVVTCGDPRPACDFIVPLLALPQFLLPSEQHIPTKMPYLFAGGKKHDRPSAHSGLKIGIACSGNPAHVMDTQRSAPLAAFEHLQRHGTLFVLQNVLNQTDAAWLQDHPLVQHPTASFTDFADTAEVLESMDLVISVDTSIAHLAGALGKPLWLLLPHRSDWRWKERSSTSSPWYPTARLLRQTSEGNWKQVFHQLDQDLPDFSMQRQYPQRGAA